MQQGFQAMQPAAKEEVSEIERGARFVLQHMEPHTVPVSQEYSLASIAASLKKIAEHPAPTGIGSWELRQMSESIISALNAQTSEMGRFREELTRTLRQNEQIMLQVLDLARQQVSLTPPEHA